MDSPFIKINNRKIGADFPVYIVAELSANHNQDYDEAEKLIRAAKESGADAIKIQTYTADTLTIQCDAPEFRIGEGTLWSGQTLYELYTNAHMPWEWQPKLKKIADDLGIDLFSTPFDKTAVDFLETIGVPAHKVASFEMIDIPLIEYIALTGKPMIISTGMSSLSEIDEAIWQSRNAGAKQIALLKCTSAYPAQPEEMNLRTIADLAAKFEVPIGLSDHTLGIAVPVAAVALGACIIEKHFTLSRSIPSSDCAFSLEPTEFKSMVEAIRVAEQALGTVNYEIGHLESNSIVFRRSLFVVKDIAVGEQFTEDNVRSIRPGHGLPPKYLKDILYKQSSRNIERGTPLSWEMVQDHS